MLQPLPTSEAAAGTGGFDRVPDHISLHILNLVADVRSLARCRCVNRRWSELVPQVENVLIKVDAVIPAQSDAETLLLPFLQRFLSSILHSLTSLLKPPSKPLSIHSPSPSPSSLLLPFDRVLKLAVELPGSDLKLAEKGAVLRWKAEFGKTLKTCVILAARRMTESGEEAPEPTVGTEEGLKERVIWTIGALIAASARHHMVRDVVKIGNGGAMERLTVADRDGEGTLEMNGEGIKEWRKSEGIGEGEEGKGRTTLPAMRMRMRHQKRLELGGGVVMEGAVLVVARAAGGGDEEDADEGIVVGRAFDGVFRCAAEELMKRPRYVLDMNSF